MPWRPGFSIEVQPPGPEQPTLADLPYVPVELPAQTRPIFTLASGVLLAMAAVVLILAVLWAFTDSAEIPGRFVYVVAILLPLGAMFVLAEYRAMRRRRMPERAQRQGIVVPARVEKIDRKPEDRGDLVHYAATVYGREQRIAMPMPRHAAHGLEAGAETCLILDLHRPAAYYRFDINAAQAAIYVALQRFAAGPLPVAGVVGAPSESSPEQFELTIQTTVQDRIEAKVASTEPAAWIYHQPKWVRTLNWILAQAAIGMVLIAVLSPSVTKVIPTSVFSHARWPFAARIAGLGLVGTGALAWCIGFALLRFTRKRQSALLRSSFSDRGIDWQDVGSHGHLDWAAWEDFVETPNLFVLRSGYRRLTIPKRLLGLADEQMRYRRFLQRHLPNIRSFQ